MGVEYVGQGPKQSGPDIGLEGSNFSAAFKWVLRCADLLYLTRYWQSLSDAFHECQNMVVV